MALVEIEVVVQRATGTGLVYVVDGADVFVERADGTAIAVWQDQAGTVAVALPLKSRNGRVDGWVEGGLLLRYRAVHPSLDPAVVWEYFVSGGGPVGATGADGATGATGATGPSGDVLPAAFHVGRVAALSMPSVNYTKIMYDTKRFDVGGRFNLTTAEFAAPVAGFYNLRGRFMSDGANVDGARYVLEVRKNGVVHVELDRIRLASAHVDHSVAGSALVESAVGDLWSIVFYHDNGVASVAAQTGAQYTFFSGSYVGRT